MMEESTPGFESNLIPVMREGIEVVKMICFGKLSASLVARYSHQDKKYCSMLTGAVINEIFGTPNNQDPFASFCVDNRDIIDTEIKDFAVNFKELRIPLTDALRMQFICDKMDGHEDDQTLKHAKVRGLLLEERDLPLPQKFMEMVRRIGKAIGLIIPPLPTEAPAPDTIQ
ncbi:MAG: hypothetical protein ABFS18_14390 [Thermodesulfobacteriota bacterium]